MCDGPVYIPLAEEINEVLEINDADSRNTRRTNFVRVVDEPDIKFNINPDLIDKQQGGLFSVLNKYKPVFATSLKGVGQLKVKPYQIKIMDDAKPVKVSPRMVTVA